MPVALGFVALAGAVVGAYGAGIVSAIRATIAADGGDPKSGPSLSTTLALGGVAGIGYVSYLLLKRGR